MFKSPSDEPSAVKLAPPIDTKKIEMSWLDRIAAVISVILNPLLVFIATILLVVRQYASSPDELLLWSLVSIVFASVLPFLFILTLVRMGKLNGMHISIREQRIGPLCFSLGSGLVGTIVLHRLGAPKLLVQLGIAYVMTGGVFTAITSVWKLSFHSGALAACITALVLIVSKKLLFLFVLLPLVAWARIYRKQHTVLQNIIAVLIAIVITVTIIQLG